MTSRSDRQVLKRIHLLHQTDYEIQEMCALMCQLKSAPEPWRTQFLAALRVLLSRFDMKTDPDFDAMTRMADHLEALGSCRH